MTERDNIQRELEGLSPELAKLREQPWREPTPPSGYFEGLAGRVLERAENGRVQPLNVVWRSGGRPNRSRRVWLAAAAAAVLLVLSASVYLFSPRGHDAASLAELSSAEANAYIEGNIDEFSISLMLEAKLLQDGEQALPVDIIPGLQEEEAEEYLYEILDDEELF